jgi:single-stranded DNA-binding protein
VARLRAVREGRGVFLHHRHSEGAQVFIEGELQHRKYERTVGKEKVEWPVTEIVVSSLKKLGKAEKVEVIAGKR